MSHSGKWIWCEIVCIECASSTAGQHTSGALPRRSMEAEARANGWRWMKRADSDEHDWHCRSCQHRREVAGQ